MGTPARGWDRVEATLEAAAERFREGELSTFEVLARFATDELAVIFEIERGRAKIGGSEDAAPFALRVTTTYRLQDGDWKIVLRHADPITAEKPSDAGLG